MRMHGHPSRIHMRHSAHSWPANSMVERISAMDKAEAPSAGSRNSLFRIGKNRRGQWVVQAQSGLCGGLFVSRAEAVKFAMFENGNRPQAVIMVPDIFELDMSGKPRDCTRSTAGPRAL